MFQRNFDDKREKSEVFHPKPNHRAFCAGAAEIVRLTEFRDDNGDIFDASFSDLHEPDSSFFSTKKSEIRRQSEHFPLRWSISGF